MSKSTVKSFVKSFVAVITGDDNQVKAEKAFRQAQSALKSQIASLEGDTINLEDRVTSSQEAQALARINNGSPITDRNSYVSSLISSKNNTLFAEKALKDHKEKIAFLASELVALETEVDA